MADLVGQQFGTYRLIRLLGEGAFAEVYLGEHIHLGIYTAVKVLKTQVASGDIERFRRARYYRSGKRQRHFPQ